MSRCNLFRETISDDYVKYHIHVWNEHALKLGGRNQLWDIPQYAPRHWSMDIFGL